MYQCVTPWLVLICALVHPSASESESCRFVYTQQPSSGLTCRPEVGEVGEVVGSLSVVCEVESLAEGGFDVEWYAVLVGGMEPVLLTRPSHSVTTRTSDQGLTSTLSMPLPLDNNLHQLFCQIRLDDGTLMLPHSQPLLLSPLPTSEPCSPASLVNTTRTCVEHTAMAEDQVMFVTTTSAPSSAGEGMLSVAFYVVVSVIAVFALVIVSLTVVVVYLYRRKCGHIEAANPTDGASSACNGSEIERTTSECPDAGSASRTGSFTPTEASLPPARPPKPPGPYENVPPPRPPKPGAVDIYRTLEEGESQEPVSCSADAAPARRHRGKIKFKVLDGSSVGNYERSPTYQCSSHVVLTDSTPTSHDAPKSVPSARGKYSGDYERDPSYAAAKQIFTFDPLVPHRIPCPQEVLSGCEVASAGADVRTDKYRGDYERCANYVLPPNFAGGEESGTVCGDLTVGVLESGEPVLMDSKYCGIYERDPVYMHKLLQSSGAGCHGYAALQPTTRQPPQPYTATLTHATPTSPPALQTSPSHSDHAITHSNSSSSDHMRLAPPRQ